MRRAVPDVCTGQLIRIYRVYSLLVSTSPLPFFSTGLSVKIGALAEWAGTLEE